MKRITAFLVIVLMLGLTISVSADNYAEYHIDECGMRIEIPDGLIILTRNTTADDPIVAQYGIDLNAIQSFFRENDIYLDAFDENVNSEIIITVAPSESTLDFTKASNLVLKNLAESVQSDYEEEGIHIENYSVYKQKEIKFIVQEGYVDPVDEQHNIKMYITSINGKTIGIAMNSYTGPLSDAQKETIQYVVDSVDFDSISSSSPGEPTDAGSAAPAQKSSNSNLMMIFYVLIGVAVLVLLVYLFLRKSSKKNQSNFSGDIYNQPFGNEPVTGTYPHSVPLSENLPTSESIPVHEDFAENKVTDADIKPAEYILCPNCSERLKSDAVFCPFCGARLARPDFEADDYEPTIRAD